MHEPDRADSDHEPADAVLAMSTSIGTIASWFKRRGIVVSINARLRPDRLRR